MAQVVRLKAGDQLPAEGDFLSVTRVGRVRAFEYFIDPSPSLEPKVGERVPRGGPGYASLDSALEDAQTLADLHGAAIIYVQDPSVIVRPYFSA
jgi:hypothetical protein